MIYSPATRPLRYTLLSIISSVGMNILEEFRVSRISDKQSKVWFIAILYHLATNKTQFILIYVKARHSQHCMRISKRRRSVMVTRYAI